MVYIYKCFMLVYDYGMYIWMFHVSWLLLRSAPPQNPVAGPGGPPMWVWSSSHAVWIIIT